MLRSLTRNEPQLNIQQRQIYHGAFLTLKNLLFEIYFVQLDHGLNMCLLLTLDILRGVSVSLCRNIENMVCEKAFDP